LRILAKRIQRRFWPNEANVPALHPRLAGVGRDDVRWVWSTNLWLWEMIARSAFLFPACSLQGTMQLQRVGEIKPSRPYG
jgi:hypothetical protein